MSGRGWSTHFFIVPLNDILDKVVVQEEVVVHEILISLVFYVPLEKDKENLCFTQNTSK